MQRKKLQVPEADLEGCTESKCTPLPSYNPTLRTYWSHFLIYLYSLQALQWPALKVYSSNSWFAEFNTYIEILAIYSSQNNLLSPEADAGMPEAQGAHPSSASTFKSKRLKYFIRAVTYLN